MTYSEEQYQDILAVCRSYKNDYDRAFERLKAQQREIDALKEENKNLKDDFDSLYKDYEFIRDCDAEHCLEIEETVKQSKIDVLNELKEKCTYSFILGQRFLVERDIDQMIEEIEK